MDELPEDCLLLYENLWWPGLTLLNPRLADHLLSGTHHQRTGLLLDTGHLMNTSTNLATEDEAVRYVRRVVRGLGGLRTSIYGMHLHRSLSGAFVRRRMAEAEREDLQPRGFSEVFQNDMESLWHNVSVMSILLSEDMTALLEDTLVQQGLSFEELDGNVEATKAVEDAMLEPLSQYVRQADCSGAFVVLESSMSDGDTADARSGLYVQRANAGRVTNNLLLFRGIASVGKAHNVMPHRKWAQEFHIGQFPNYAEHTMQAAAPIADSRRTTVAAKEHQKETGHTSSAIELEDGTIITAHSSELLGCSAALLLNVTKHLAGIDHEVKLIPQSMIEPIQHTKISYLGGRNPRLHTDEVLVALSVLSENDDNCRRALEQLPKLRGCQVHCTVMLSDVDHKIFKKLGVGLTCEPVLKR